MNLATHLIALIFAGLAAFLFWEADIETRRLGVAALAFACSVWMMELGFRVHGLDLTWGQARRARQQDKAGVTFGPVRARLGAFATACLALAVTPALICGSLTAWPTILLGGPPLAAAAVLTVWALDPRPVIRITGGGLFDRRCMREPAPWREVVGLSVDEDGLGSLTLAFRDPQTWRRTGFLSGATAAPGGVRIHTLLLDGAPADVMAAARARWDTR